MTKFEWRKHAKEYYLPKATPELIEIPEFRFITICGSGNPNSPDFADRVAVLYALSYAIKMAPKKGINPVGYFDYTVFPLEGVWDINDEAKRAGNWDKDQLVYKLMIRQPDFVTVELFNQVRELVCSKDDNPLLLQPAFEHFAEGRVVQCLHVGSYDSEPETFTKMAQFCQANNLSRLNKIHREIYLSDARKVIVEKLQTVLRFTVE